MKIELQKSNRKFVLVVVVFKRQLISKTSQKDVGDAGTTKICCKIPYSSKYLLDLIDFTQKKN